jgi:hypothetical protein
LAQTWRTAQNNAKVPAWKIRRPLAGAGAITRKCEHTRCLPRRRWAAQALSTGTVTPGFISIAQMIQTLIFRVDASASEW